MSSVAHDDEDITYLAANEVQVENVDPEPELATVGGFPLNRVVAFLGPHISWLAGLIVAKLVDVLDVLNLDATVVSDTLQQVITFVVVAGLTWIAQHKWLDGFSKYEREIVAATTQLRLQQDFTPAGDPETLGVTGEEPHPVAPTADDVPTPEGGVAGKPGLAG